jgi:hypothetical protein
MSNWNGVTPDQVVAAMQQFVLEPGERLEKRRDHPDSLTVTTSQFSYKAAPAEWSIGRQRWVAGAVRIVADSGMNNFAITYGLVFEHAGPVWYLNDVDTMRALGGRVGPDLEPMAYAELLAELYSGRRIDGPVVSPYAATPLHQAGELVRDVGPFLSRYSFVDPSLVDRPTLRPDGDRIQLDFFSCHYYLLEVSAALDIIEWTVAAGGGHDATWTRRYVVERLEH